MALLVPVDLTAPSRAAIEVVTSIAATLQLHSVLLHVSDSPPPLKGLAALHRLAEPLRRASLGASLRTFSGDPVSVICREAAARHALWVVMGTRGERSGPGGAGSVARGVMNRCSVPVVAVRPGRHRPGPRVLLVGTGNDHSGPAALVARIFGDESHRSPDRIDLERALASRNWGDAWDVAVVPCPSHRPPDDLYPLLEDPTPTVLLVSTPRAESHNEAGDRTQPR